MNTRELIDLKSMQPLLENHWRLTGVPVRLFLANGEKTAELGKPAVCSRFHERHPTTREICMKTRFLETMSGFSAWKQVFSCPNGLREVALPLELEGEKIGVLFLGPFWLETDTLAIAVFRDRARTYGFDEDPYLDAVRSVPILSPAHLEQVIAFYTEFLKMLSHLGARNLRWRREAEERNRAELMAAESETKYRMLVESSSDLIYSIDSGGIFTFLSAGVEKFGYKPDEVLGKPMFQFIHPDDRPGVVEKFREGFRRGAHPTMNSFRVLKKDGGFLHVEEAGRIICDDQGRPVMVTGILRDVTHRTRAEEALRRGKEMAEAASRAKSEFLASMSHEIRTPMNAILGFSDLVLQAPLAQEIRTQMEIVKKSGHDLLGIIDDLLDLARVEAEQIRIEARPFRLIAVVKEVLQTFDSRARDRGIRLIVDIPTGFPDWWLGDGLRLKQILNNLIGNALKFTREGSITISLSADRDSSNGTNVQNVKLKVTDTGIGIPADKLQAIFEPFMQVEAGYSRRFGGVGLGLAISRRLVEYMGGRIVVESEVGRGSAFSFLVPLRHLEREGVAQTVTVVETLRTGPVRALNILLAEDEPMSSFLAQTILAREGHRVTSVENGRDALAALEQARFDVVLMDVSMPEMDGLEAARRIRDRERRESSAPAGTISHLPIIALTAHAMKGDEDVIRDSGMDAYLTKPFVPDRLLALIQQVTSPVLPDEFSASE